MSEERLEPELQRRLDLVAEPDYEGEPLTTLDYAGLVMVGIILPFALMLWGWS